MTITSFSFILFAFATLILYYCVPKRGQWMILLLASVVFYLLVSLAGAVFVLITASTVYAAARWLGKETDKRKAYLKSIGKELTKEEKAKYKAGVNRKRKVILVVTLVMNVGILCFFKYCHFAIDSANGLISLFNGKPIEDTLKVIVPLGISFYTFQSVGYLVDIYWEYYVPERSYFKTLLFVCFFPQMTQGPISDFEQLSKELYSEHTFTYENYARGFQRMIWGFMKKMVIANTLAPWVSDVFFNYGNYTGITVLLGAFMYSVQIYADFSGYMDIMCGFCEMLGITLVENFDRPYFSKSVAEYWRRWHITLGTWFKKYIYYPIAMSNRSRKIAKMTSRFGKHFSNTLPATLALIVTWAATGIWHGASWAYVAWGLVNGLFIILSLWMEPINGKIRNRLRMTDQNGVWKCFRVLRTFTLVTFIKVLPEVGTLSQGVGLWKRAVSAISILPKSLLELMPFLKGCNMRHTLIVALLIVLWVITSVLQRKKPIRDYFSRVPKWLRIVVLAGIFFIIVVIGVPASKEGVFLYEQF